MNVVVTGVGWTGRAQVGAALAGRLDGRFIPGDDLWPRTDSPLSDDGVTAPADLDAWFDAVGFKLALRGRATVISCTALRRADRDRIRFASFGDVRFLLLHGTREMIESRMLSQGASPSAGRETLDRHFAALELPEAEPGVILANIATPPLQIASEVSAQLLDTWHDDSFPVRRSA